MPFCARLKKPERIAETAAFHPSTMNIYVSGLDLENVHLDLTCIKKRSIAFDDIGPKLLDGACHPNPLRHS